MRTCLAVLLLIPAAALASSPFDGTWKMRADTLKVTGKPDVIALTNGEYSCVSCAPPLSVKADGKEHAVTGQASYDAAIVSVVSATTIEQIYKKNGKETMRETDVVSADGKSFTGTFSDHTGAKEATGSYTETRVAAGPAGSHAISGSWQQSPGITVNDAASTIQYQLAGDHLKANFNGMTYDAPLDGTQVPIKGDPGHTMVSVKRADANTILQTNTRQGKVIDEVRIAVAPGGNTMNVEDKAVQQGQTVTFMVDKQ